VPADRVLLVIPGGDHTGLCGPLRELAGQHRLVLPGLPGGPDTPEDAVAGLLALLDRLGLADVDLLGFSCGGLLAQRLAVAAPARVRRLIIASSSIGPVPGAAQRLSLLGVPILLLHGEHDMTTPAAVITRAATRIPGATAVILGDAGHMAHIDQPRRWLAAITRFLGPADGGEWLAVTPRLRLRRLRASDAAALPDIAEPAWFAPRAGGATLSPWAIVRRDSGLVAGYCGLLLRPAKGVTLGYAITAGQRGQGFAAEAAGALLAWAEQRHPGVYASIRPPNPASERVLQKIGMRLTASYTDEHGVRNVYRRRPG
jgi:hypothetical protein